LLKTKREKEKKAMKELRVRLTFTEEVLGTANSDKKIHEEFIASKAPDAMSREEEIEALGVDKVVEKGKTIFPKDENGNPFLFDYQIRGFFKTAAKACGYTDDEESPKLAAYKTKIDLLIFIEERTIPFKFPNGKITIGDCQRPLRAQTAQGERVSLANSETVPAGSTVEFTIQIMADKNKDNLEKHIRAWLDYGKLNGIGQWRNSGKGRFLWDELDKDGNIIPGGNNKH
jgi:hypothetical protein